MGFRTVVVKTRAKLELRLNYLIVRGDSEKKILLDEINTIIVQSTAVSLTAALLSELTKNNVKVIFCDEKCNPTAELLPYYGAHNTSKRYKLQFNWACESKNKIWQAIITKKITEQASHLLSLGFKEQADLLYSYAGEVLPGDITNREGHSAKVYFNCILNGGSRDGGGFINGCLNYGYSVLLSAFNREIVAGGYLTQLGIWHDNEFNPFNLSCDLMEPLRVVVDRVALSIPDKSEGFKRVLANILNLKAVIQGKNTTLDVAIRQYVRSCIHAIESGDAGKIAFIEEVSVNDEL